VRLQLLSLISPDFLRLFSILPDASLRWSATSSHACCTGCEVISSEHAQQPFDGWQSRLHEQVFRICFERRFSVGKLQYSVNLGFLSVKDSLETRSVKLLGDRGTNFAQNDDLNAESFASSTSGAILVLLGEDYKKALNELIKLF